jgi:hypothetical protein
MRASRITVLAVAALIATPLAGLSIASAASASPASIGYSQTGYGPTLAAAELDARKTLQGDDGPCTGVSIYAYGQLADGTWWADASGECNDIYH